jgi:hypothetical protein
VREMAATDGVGFVSKKKALAAMQTLDYRYNMQLYRAEMHMYHKKIIGQQLMMFV